MKLKYYQDPGHGWIKVNKALLQRLGIAGDISRYSYMRGDCAYLEEDCDASRLFEAAKAAGIVIQLNDFHTNKQSKIRAYESYKNERPLEDFFKYTLNAGRLEFYTLGAEGFTKIEIKK